MYSSIVHVVCTGLCTCSVYSFCTCYVHMVDFAVQFVYMLCTVCVHVVCTVVLNRHKMYFVCNDIMQRSIACARS